MQWKHDCILSYSCFIFSNIKFIRMGWQKKKLRLTNCLENFFPVTGVSIQSYLNEFLYKVCDLLQKKKILKG